MRLKVVPSGVECPHHFLQAFTSSVPRSVITSPSCSKKDQIRRMVSHSFHSDPFVSENLLKSSTYKRIQTGRTIQRPSCSSLDEIYNEEPSSLAEGLFKSSHGVENEGHASKELRHAISERSPFAGRHEKNHDLFFSSRTDFLEPMMLGIKPDLPDRPDQETVLWASIEQKAKSLEIPLSLRMIKKKLKCEEGFVDSKESSTYSSAKAAFASMVSIVVELQSHALEMRETLCREDLEVIIFKVQKEMHSSFVWLFQQVFSRTPDLMLEVMILLANFSVFSVSDHVAAAGTSLSRASFELSVLEKQIQQSQPINKSAAPNLISEDVTGGQIGEDIQNGDLPLSSRNSSVHLRDQFRSKEEKDLWNSMLDDVTKDKLLDNDLTLRFVSPVSVELEPDVYEDYLRTDLLYQMNLGLEPDNTLLLCNYAQFLYLVTHDYNRAEECLKRAVQVSPPDAEALNQYANFLWTVKKDFWGAEERFLQALAAEPNNSYYAARYANFLWSNGGEETCFPLKNSSSPNL